MTALEAMLRKNVRQSFRREQQFKKFCFLFVLYANFNTLCEQFWVFQMRNFNHLLFQGLKTWGIRFHKFPPSSFLFTDLIMRNIQKLISVCVNAYYHHFDLFIITFHNIILNTSLNFMLCSSLTFCQNCSCKDCYLYIIKILYQRVEDQVAQKKATTDMIRRQGVHKVETPACWHV